MESIYYVLSWACHRKCRHCYEPRFRPYARGALDRVVAQARAAAPRIIDHLPDRLTYRDTHGAEHPGRIILAGGEVLLDPVREAVLYPALEQIARRYAGQGVRVVVQTTGDLVTPAIVGDLLARGVGMISISGMDDYHVGLEGDRRLPLHARLVAMFAAAGLRDAGDGPTDAPVYGFFGATDDAWIGKIWPRGRAWDNGLSRATLADNFCDAWSGGRGFLDLGRAGSEVSIDPDGDVYPCCLKTRAPLGNLVEEPLEAILASLRGHPAFEAISAGQPQRMGLDAGWDEARFLAACATTTPDGRPYANLCIGCDRFHEAVLAPVLAQIRAARRGAIR